jgi:Transposase DDE domain group 1
MSQSVPRTPLLFHFFRRPIEAAFDAERISSDGGALLLRQVDDRLGLSAGVAGCLPDDRRAHQVIHPRVEQVRQRLYQIALGYPDCNDADTLRTDPVLKAACGRLPQESKGLSSQSTLTRLDNVATPAVIRKLLRHGEDGYVASLPADTLRVVLDLDTTDDPAHGQQELIGFNAYYDTHMYLHLVVYDDQGQLITAMLRPGRSKASFGVSGLLMRLVRKLKARFARLQIVVRGDSAFATPEVLNTIEQLNKQYGDVDYLFGYAKNARLEKLLAPQMEEARLMKQAGSPNPVLFSQFLYQTEKSWPHPRLVVGKAEYTALGPNPRFAVTSIEGFDPKMLYRNGYCERGNAENSIKDLKNALHSDRLSCHGLWANFLRLLLFVAAYRLMYALRQTVLKEEKGLQADKQGLALALPSLPSDVGDRGTAQSGEAKPLLTASAQSLQFDTLRLKLLKVGAQVEQRARRIVVRLCSAFPYQELFARVVRSLQQGAHLVGAPSG